MSFFDLPVTAGPRDPQIGIDELGRPVFRAVDGTTYGAAFAPPPQRDLPPMQGPVRNELRGDRRGRRDIPGNPNALADGFGPIVNALAQGFTAPGRALQGQPVTMGDTFATAMDFGLLGAPMAAPRGALRAGGMRSANDFEFTGYRTVERGTDPTSPSRVWVDGDPTDELLGGVSVTDARYKNAKAMHGLEKPNYRDGYYSGDETYLVGGNLADAGEDAGELVIRDPVVLAQLVRKYGIAGAAAMLGVSAADIEGAMAGQ